MSIDSALLPDPQPLRAIAVARDLSRFEGLIEAMESEVGAAWAEFDHAGTHPFLRSEDAGNLECLIVAADAADAADVDAVTDVLRHAASLGRKVVLVSRGLSAESREAYLQYGVDATLACPVRAAALRETLARVARTPKASPDGEAAGSAGRRPGERAGDKKLGAIFAVQSAAGGDGATTVAVNLGWELATMGRDRAPRVCIIDLGLQFGSVATYLDLPRKPVILEMLSDVAAMDEEAFRQALGTYREKLSVFTAPGEILPLDLIGPDDVSGLLGLARKCFDIVIVDMPATITAWTDTVFGLADLYFVVCGLEVRSAQNAMRFHKLLQAEGLSTERMSFLLNRAPGRMDLSGRGRIDKMAASIGVPFHAVFPDGGQQVTEANDAAAPLAVLAPRNPLTREVRKLASGLQEARLAIQADGGPSRARPKPARSFLGLKFG